MNKYLFIECRVGGLLGKTEHREIIARYAVEGWRFIKTTKEQWGKWENRLC